MENFSSFLVMKMQIKINNEEILSIGKDVEKQKLLDIDGV